MNGNNIKILRGNTRDVQLNIDSYQINTKIELILER